MKFIGTMCVDVVTIYDVMRYVRVTFGRIIKPADAAIILTMCADDGSTTPANLWNNCAYYFCSIDHPESYTKIMADIPDYQYHDFTDDEEKMRDFEILTKEQFLESYSYLTEGEYDMTVAAMIAKYYAKIAPVTL